MPTKIRWKIAAPYLVLTLVVAVAGTFLATRVIVDSLDSRFSAQLVAAGNATSDAIVSREDAHLETVRSIMYTVGVTDAVAAGDREQLRSLVEPILANDRRDYAEIFDASGRPLLNLRIAEAGLPYEETADTSDVWSTQAVQAVLAGGDGLGDKSAELVRNGDQTVLYSAGPVLDGDRRIGVILVGSSLDTLLPAIKLDALSDVTFYDLQGGVLGTTRAGSASDLAGALHETSASLDPAAVAGLRQSTSVSGVDTDLLYGELRVRDQTIGLFSVSLPSAFIASASRNTRTVMFTVFGAASIAALAIGVAVAHGVTRPLLSLVRSAHVIAGGDLSVRAPVRSRDEVGALAVSFNVMTERLANQHLQTIRALTSAIDARDPYTAGHSLRVGQLSVEIGREIGLPRRDLQYLEIGGYLHDIGKIGIRDHILLKEGPLTEEERRLIEEHPRIGMKIIRHVDLASQVLDVVAGHHEKLNGSGYPYGRAEDEISIYARIAAVSDIYDALTTERPYKPALEVAHAVKVLREEVVAGQIDGRAVEGLVRVLPKWRRRLRIDESLQGLSILELEPDEGAAGRQAG